ncbi:DgyrCDS9699 [Dimorphilus gyrociliatus]|uniref:DgyrCDS9699 n=1 Tax=Dimorphilus gyrociliatus TaxID=2664684 RepID=A0A7I8VXQ7_9ANNE|nr:DgyrCDS9699 [Dimorphilus gyrociliatus]
MNTNNCDLLDISSLGDSLTSNPSSTLYIKPQCVSLFNISASTNCLSGLSTNNFLKSLGDGLQDCQSNPPKLSIGSIITFRATVKMLPQTTIYVTIHKVDKANKCDDIMVVNDPNDKLKMCDLIEDEDNLCKFSCSGKNWRMIKITNYSLNIQICEIQLSSSSRLANVCA